MALKRAVFCCLNSRNYFLPLVALLTAGFLVAGGFGLLAFFAAGFFGLVAVFFVDLALAVLGAGFFVVVIFFAPLAGFFFPAESFLAGVAVFLEAAALVDLFAGFLELTTLAILNDPEAPVPLVCWISPFFDSRCKH